MKYVRCDSHCKFPAYDKEEVDSLLSDKANKTDVYTKTEADTKHNELIKKVYVKDDYAVLTGTITMASGTGSTTVNYPTGFTKNNCVVISYGQENADTKNSYNFGYGIKSTDYTRGSMTRNVSLKDSNIEISIYNPVVDGEGNKTYNYKIVLMKIA